MDGQFNKCLSTIFTMKSIFLLPMLCTSLLFAEEKEPLKAPELLPYQQDFLNLPREQRAEFFKLLKLAQKKLSDKSVFLCFETLDKAEAIFPNSPELLSIKGAAFTELRMLDRAMETYEKTLEFLPDSITTQYNIGEVLFANKKWQESHDQFSKVLSKLDENQIEFKRMVEFKILLCLLKLDREDEAQKISNQYDYKDDSPFHYYAMAAFKMHKGSPNEANDWVMRANRIFKNPNLLRTWNDGLLEAGYLKGIH